MVLIFARLRFNQRPFEDQMRPRHAKRYFLTDSWGGITVFHGYARHKFHQFRTPDCFAKRSRQRNYTQRLNVASRLAGGRNPFRGAVKETFESVYRGSIVCLMSAIIFGFVPLEIDANLVPSK
jgi:hypothetical protein